MISAWYSTSAQDHRRRRGGQRKRRHAEAGGKHGCHGGSRERVAQLVAGVVGLAAHARDAAEQPQVYLLHFDAATSRNDGMTELVREDAREQQQGAEKPQGV